ncbi:MAG: leucine-rich repeat protein [Parabacteroides sp.]|nr:leucine-rich repeat protein [Parabacteroides sp.]
MRQTLQISRQRSSIWISLVIGLLLFGSSHIRAEGLSADELSQIKQQFFFFQNRYYKSNAWDCSRNPPDAEAEKKWELYNFKDPFDASTTEVIDFGTNSDRFLQFNIENFNENEHSEYSYITDESGNKLIITLKLYEADGAFVSTVSSYGTIQGLSKDTKGIFYEQQGHYGTFLTMEDFKAGDGVTYTPETGVVKSLSELELVTGTWKYDATKEILTHKSGLVINHVTSDNTQNINQLSIGDNTENTNLNNKYLNLTGRIAEANATDANTEYIIGTLSESAFEGITLQSLTLPHSITAIGNDAFKNASIETIHLSHEEAGGLTIGTEAFALKDKEHTMVYVPADKLGIYHTEDMEQLTVSNWQDFTYVLEEGAKTYAIEYIIDEAHQAAIAGLPTKAPVGQLFTFPINIKDLIFNITTTTTLAEGDLFNYDPTGDTKLAIKLNNVPEGGKLTIRINGSIKTDSDKGLIIETDTEYKEGEEGTTQKFNGILEAEKIKSLQIGKTDAASTVNITVKGTTVLPNAESGKAATTITEKTTATLTFSGTNDLGKVENNGTLTFQKKTGEGEQAPIFGSNTTVTNNATFTDETGLIKSVSGSAPIEVAEGTSMEQAISIVKGSSKDITLTATTSATNVTLSYTWLKKNADKWEHYPKQKANTRTTLDASSSGKITFIEDGEYRCLMTSTVTPTTPVTKTETPAVSSTLTAYVTVTVTEPEPDPVYHYTVKIPEIEGATLSVTSGYHIVEEGYSFDFTIALNADYDQSTPLVKANEEIIEPDAQGRYVIRWIYTDQIVNISGIVKNLPTGIDQIEGTTAKVWSADGTLYIYTPEAADVHIVNFSGKTIQTIRKIDGEYHARLPKGHYIVTIGDDTFKIAL